MDETFSKLKVAFEEEKRLIAQEREKLELERKELEKDTKEISKIRKRPLDDVLTLNVGGKKTTTQRSTLTQVKGSLLDTMFNSSFWEEKLNRDKEGYIFLDFDPQLFGKVIGYLRARLISEDPSSVPLPIVAREDEDNFKGLIAYLRLTEVAPTLELPNDAKDRFHTTDNLKIINDGAGVEKQGNQFHAWVKGKEVISKGEYTWKLKIEEFNHWMLIGVINANEKMVHPSYNLPSAFGWGGFANGIFISGNPSQSEWGRWAKGQEIELTLDCTKNSLILRIVDGGTSTLKLTGNGPWQLHLNLHTSSTKVLLL